MEHKWIKLENDSWVYYSMGHYWVYDTNEGVVEAYMNPDHQRFENDKGKVLFAVTHYVEYYVPNPPRNEL